MVLKMTMSFTRSMAAQAVGAKCAADSPVSNLNISTPTTAKHANQREERRESTESSSYCSSSVLDEVGLEDVTAAALPEQKAIEAPEEAVPSDETPPVTLDAISHGLIEISLAHEEECGPTQSDLDAIDELIECAKEGDLPMFQRQCDALARRHITPDCAGYMGWTPAHWAARHGHVHLLEFLLQREVNLDLLDKKGDSLLHKAAANGQFRACQWLLQHGFNVQTRNNNGQTPLDVAQELVAMARSHEAALCESILARENEHTF